MGVNNHEPKITLSWKANNCQIRFSLNRGKSLFIGWLLFYIITYKHHIFLKSVTTFLDSFSCQNNGSASDSVGCTLNFQLATNDSQDPTLTGFAMNAAHAPDELWLLSRGPWMVVPTNDMGKYQFWGYTIDPHGTIWARPSISAYSLVNTFVLRWRHTMAPCYDSYGFRTTLETLRHGRPPQLELPVTGTLGRPLCFSRRPYPAAMGKKLGWPCWWLKQKNDPASLHPCSFGR